MTPKTKVVSVRLPEEIKNGLRRLAITTDRSVGYHAQKAIEKYLEEEAGRNCPCPDREEDC